MKDLLIEKILKQGFKSDSPLPIVSVEDFFNGNDEVSSIGCNLLNHPGIEKFNEVLMNVKNMETVQDVFVEIYELEEELWPFSERVYVISSENHETMEKLLEKLEPSDIREGWNFGVPNIAPRIAEGFKVFSIWWD